MDFGCPRFPEIGTHEGPEPEVPAHGGGERRHLRNLAPAIRASLEAKRERLLIRPLIATLVESPDGAQRSETPDLFHVLAADTAAMRPRSTNSCHEDPEDGTCTVLVRIDYDGTWRDREKEVLETVGNNLEGALTLLTDAQRELLERSPRQFLAQRPAPESLELVEFYIEDEGNRRRVVGLKFATAPQFPSSIRHIAIVPNLVQIERQLESLHLIETALDTSPLAGLRALVGLCSASLLDAEPAMSSVSLLPGERLDEFQLECVTKAMCSPHFTVIQGPPGSGKTTVISGIIRRATARGDRVLVVSPTHVAVDNVVEKLVSASDKELQSHALPVRYAARPRKLTPRAFEYWVGGKTQRRGAAVARRVEASLRAALPFTAALFDAVDENAPGNAPLSSAIAGVDAVICGTPIGVLSYEPVKNAAPGVFDLLIVDEVSKMTLSEFLAIAVKARRWVLVGDPQQLPPFNNAEENAVTLDDVLGPELELVLSAGAVFEKVKPANRASERLLVVASSPARIADAVRGHFADVGLNVSVSLTPRDTSVGVIVVGPTEVEGAIGVGREMRVLAERGLELAGVHAGSQAYPVEPRLRAGPAIFENAFQQYHAQPWSIRSRQRLELLAHRNGMSKCLPSEGAVRGLEDDLSSENLHERIAERFAVNAVAVYDWLTGIPSESFDTRPLSDLGDIGNERLHRVVATFTGTLKRQYRMHPSLSRVPRELFYFGEALHDGVSAKATDTRVQLLQVQPSESPGESNPAEVEVITNLLTKIDGSLSADERPTIMVITPYKKQEELLARRVDALRRERGLTVLEPEVCTLDRCQGREADYVFISLVRGRSSPFLDMPKRWNVALTRAMKGMFIVGNIDAYLAEASRERSDPRGKLRPRMSVIARALEAYRKAGVR